MQKAIDRLFQRLGATYGAAWDKSLGDAPISDVKTVWCHELDCFKASLFRLAWALENLPNRCPNVIEFKNLCRQAPAQDLPKLPEPAANPARVSAELAKLAPLIAKVTQSPVDHKAWAKKLKARHEAGEKLNLNQIRCYKAALS